MRDLRYLTCEMPEAGRDDAIHAQDAIQQRQTVSTVTLQHSLGIHRIHTGCAQAQQAVPHRTHFRQWLPIPHTHTAPIHNEISIPVPVQAGEQRTESRAIDRSSVSAVVSPSSRR